MWCVDVTGLMALAVIPLPAEAWLSQRTVTTGAGVTQGASRGWYEWSPHLIPSCHWLWWAPGCASEKGELWAKRRQEIYADQEGAQDERWQSEEVSSEVREGEGSSLPEEAFFQQWSLGMSSWGEPCLCLVSGPKTDFMKERNKISKIFRIM